MFTGGHAVLKGEGCIWGCRSQCFIRSLRILSSWINSVTSLTGPFHGGRAISTQKKILVHNGGRTPLVSCAVT